MSLLRELQRRKVLRVAGAYAVVGWLVIQVAETVAPQLNLPEWAPRLITLTVLLGFPVALVLAWMLDHGPGGLVVERASAGNKRMFAIAGVLALLAVGWYFYDRGEATPQATDMASARSIAVLPFVNMSGDSENEYFSDGISEEILNSLAQMPDLRVAARTSSFSFKGANKEIPEIARELEVRMVLEGSVRKQGQKVRITAQLIDADQGFHVWSQTYDRDLNDIFVIQDEIAHAIARELQIKLGAAHGSGGPRADTGNLEAYDAYLKALSLWQARGKENLFEAERLLRTSLALDPGFAKAWSALALTLTVLPEWSSAPLAESWLEARDAAEHALALEPTLPEPFAVLGYIAGGEFRFATSRALFKRALALAPSYATGHQWHAEMLTYEGDFARADEVSLKSVQLDPKSPIMRWARNNVLWGLGRDDEVVAVCKTLLLERPDWRLCEAMTFNVTVLREDFAAARAMLRRMAQPRGAEAVRLADDLVDALEGKGDTRAVAERLMQLSDGTVDPTSLTPLGHPDIVFLLARMGHTDLALVKARLFAEAYPHFARAMVFDPHLRALGCEPGFQELARELEVDDARIAALCADQPGG